MLNPFIKEKLDYILEHAKMISVYYKGINQPGDFKTTEEGIMKFDAIISRLQALAENFKKIEKIQPGFVEKNITAEIEKIIKFRDFISHHYEKLDYAIIFEICRDNIPLLIPSIQDYLSKT